MTLTKYLSCPVDLDMFAISPGSPLALCTIPATEFVVDPQCGDKSISSFMFDGKTPVLFSVYPNPASGDEITASVSLPEKTLLSFDIINALGNIIRHEVIPGELEKGDHALKIGTAKLPDGIYYLRLRAGNGSYSSAPIVISK